MWSATSFRQKFAAAILIALMTACSPGKQADRFPVGIEITHQVATQPLRLDGALYKTSAGDEYSVDHLRYYLSNFRLRRTDGTWFVSPQNAESSQGYFLVDAALKQSQTFSIGPVPAGEYSGIEFLIGVDTARNSAGAQSGTLDPARGMFWTWNTGYIFFKLEGHSPQSSSKQHELTYHLGGSEPISGARLVFLPLGAVAIKVDAKTHAQIHLSADISQVFEAAHRIRIAELSEAMSPKAGVPIADNIAGLFRVAHVHNDAVAGNATAP